jgi:hypothetical protein
MKNRFGIGLIEEDPDGHYRTYEYETSAGQIPGL